MRIFVSPAGNLSLTANPEILTRSRSDAPGATEDVPANPATIG
jgi:hypothetical protein